MRRPERSLSGSTLLVGVVTICISGLNSWADCGKGGSLSEILPGCFQNPVVELNANGHQSHFEAQDSILTTMEAVNAAVGAQFSTYPLGSSSGGFTYTFDSAVGTYSRSTDSFGPSFAERALTLGKKKLNVGVGYVHSSFDSIDGQDLRHGDIGVNLTHLAEDPNFPPPYWEGDLIRADVFMDLTLDTALLFANYGISERFDVGVVVPLVRAEMDVRMRLTIDPVASGGGIHSFPGSHPLQQNSTDGGSATGVGDVILRVKHNFMRRPEGGLAWALDLRLPTGDEKDFLGSGATQAKLFLVASGKVGSFWPHANVGYTFSSGGSDVTGDPPDEINYTLGFDVALHPKLTFATDFVGRTLLDAQRVGQTTQRYNYTTALMDTGTAFRSTVEPVEGNASLLVASTGFKYNPTGGLLVSVGALVSLSRDTGLQDDIAAVVGVDYSF